jgi:exopolysaccharide production protein ExoZ
MRENVAPAPAQLREGNAMKATSVISSLQICRGLAALLVVVGHSLHDLDSIAARAGLEPLHTSINWGCGIDIFFVISGFIMVHVAAPEFATPGAPWRFMSKRLARIVPLYWLVTTVLIVGALVAPSLLNVPIGGAQHIVSSYLFIPDWRPDMSVVRPVMALGWTLNYEMLFYVFFACAMFLPFPRAVAALTIVFVGGVIAKRVFQIEQTQLAFWMDPLVLEFLFGVYVGMAYRAGWRLNGPTALILGALGFVGVATGLPEALGISIDANFIRYGVPAALLIAAATLGPNLPDMLPVRFGAALGDSSYALYLIHPFIIRPLREVWLRMGGAALPLAAYVVVCVILAVLAAFALHYWLELPIGRALKPFQAGTRPRAAPSPLRDVGGEPAR